MALHHTSESISVADKTSLKVLKLDLCPSKILCKLNEDIMGKQVYEMVCVEEFAPSDRKKRYLFIQDLCEGLSKRCVMCTFSVGGPMGKVWSMDKELLLVGKVLSDHDFLCCAKCFL